MGRARRVDLRIGVRAGHVPAVLPPVSQGVQAAAAGGPQLLQGGPERGDDRVSKKNNCLLYTSPSPRD
eukprot:5673899-Alexandrium_andersonii.AAC.1